MTHSDETWPVALPIVDAHHHFWDLDQNIYPWLQQWPPPQLVCGDISPIRHSYLPDHLRADIGMLPVLKTVHLQCDWDPRDPVGETRWLDGLTRDCGLPTAIVAFARLEHPDVEALLDEHLASSNRVRGIRQILNWHDDKVLTFGAPKGLMADPGWRAGFAALDRRGLSFDLQMYPHQMSEAASLARDFPSTRIIINHAGMPLDRTADGWMLYRSGLRQLAQCENVAIKISGLGMVDHNWTVDSLRPIVSEVLDIFGPYRAMFASNFPVDRLYSDYRTLWMGFLELTKDLSDGERRMLFSESAEYWYRI